MCTSLISRNDDLSKLKEAGYHLQLCGLYLLVQGIPYVTESGEIQTANIVTHLEVSGATGENLRFHQVIIQCGGLEEFTQSRR